MGINAERKLYIESVGLNEEDTLLWVDKWCSLKRNTKQYCICLISFEDYIRLALDAGLASPKQIGININSFQMGRIGDVGNYEIGNCRFITARQNLDERKINGGDAAMSNALRGRTKENHPGVAAMAAKASIRGASPITVKKLSRNYLLISPDGEKFEGSNVSQFCRENNLCQVSICNVCRGTQKSYKGWTGYYKEKLNEKIS